MTREEAIPILRQIAASYGDVKKYYNAMSMAIEALEQEPCTDVISRQAAIDALMELLDRPNHAEFLYTDEICRALNYLPSVTLRLCGECPLDYEKGNMGEQKECLRMSVEALERELCEDAISRKAVISTIYDDESDFKNDFAQGFFADKIRDLKTVTPQLKVGHCKDCRYFEYDSIVSVKPFKVAHEICERWGNGYKTKEDGYCFLFKPKTEDMEE